MDAKQATTTTKSRETHEEDHQVVVAADSPTSIMSLKLQQQQQGGKDSTPSSPPLPQKLSPPSPPSLSTSPTHEFSFTISLHHAPTASSTTKNPSYPDKFTRQQAQAAATSPSSFAIDLSPADDIFFHGHLLPLHLLSHFPVSPRTSTTSLDSFTHPIKEILQDNRILTTNSNPNIINKNAETKPRPKSKSFSLFRLTRFRKGSELNEAQDKEQRQRKKPRFDVGHVLKRYIRLVRPLLLFRVRRRRKESIQMRGNGTGYSSYSGNLTSKTKQVLRGKQGERSAPASMRTSPTNSGLLVASTSIASSTSDSTMEELHAAIQAAIAHCKNSIAVEDKHRDMNI